MQVVEDGEYLVETNWQAEKLAERLAYWETVASKSSSFITTQSLRESTVNVVRNGIDLNALKKTLPFKDEVPLPNRRCLRYGTHGVHEYRGKFFPQLVRSLINISGTGPDGVVADPMSGSGTTVAEAKLLGCRGLGLDMNPLSVFIGNTKSELLSADPAKLKAAYIQVREAVLKPEEQGQAALTYLASLPKEDQEYLENWFDKNVLIGLDDIAQILETVKYQPAKNLMWVALSNILRSVSWQKEADLRVRREVRLDIEIDPKKEFLEELARSIRALLAFLYQNGPIKSIEHSITNGDARRCGDIWGEYKGLVDVVITSPPYATALPYLDTDRLSLCYLGLLPRPEHRTHDQKMIGNREVTKRLRDEYLARLKSEGNTLPRSVHELIQKIEKLNEGTDAGFRRLNLPALLSKYFFDMQDVLSGVHKTLKPGGLAYVVVGNNHTIAGGERVDIWTTNLLTDIASQLDFDIQEPISMDMLVSRDIFKKNAMTSESILVFQKSRL
jgi:site-specific DNA-methyltransferase (cytosine-N4-specific)